MSKYCPDCGKELPDDAHFCLDCGYDFFQKNQSSPSAIRNITNKDSIFSNGKIFLILIAIVVVIGAVIILSFGLSGNGGNSADVSQSEGSVVDLTITEVDGWDSNSSGKHSYTLYTEALFNKIPSDLNGYNVKTTYYDKNNTEIGHEIETLSHAYHKTNYAISFGYHTTYKKPNPNHVTVEIIKDGKTVDTFTSQINQGEIDFLN